MEILKNAKRPKLFQHLVMEWRHIGKNREMAGGGEGERKKK